MNKENLLNAIDKYFQSVTPEHVISRLENAGCEFDEPASCEMSYTRLARVPLNAYKPDYTAMNVEINYIVSADYAQAEFSQFNESIDQFSSNDESCEYTTVAA